MRKICVVSGYRSDYTKLKSVLKAISDHADLELQLVVIGAHLLDDYGTTVHNIEEDHFSIAARIETNIEGCTRTSMAKSIGLTTMELTTVYATLKPDIVLVVGDRYEIFGAVVAASMSGIPVAHIQGGEISGTVDETIRHAITKLSHIHFPSTALAAKRIEVLGEHPARIFNVGCPALDVIKQHVVENEGRGSYVLILQHPDVNDYESSGKQMAQVLRGVRRSGFHAFLIFPNPDPGSVAMIRAIREFEDHSYKVILDKYKDLPFKKYLNLLANAVCLVGNSSSGLREAHVFGTPVVNVGNRQQGRDRDGLVYDVDFDADKIRYAINTAALLDHTPLKDTIFGDGTAGMRIADKLATIDLNGITEKRLWLNLNE